MCKKANAQLEINEEGHDSKFEIQTAVFKEHETDPKFEKFTIGMK